MPRIEPNELLSQVVDLGGSDLHLTVEEPPTLRIHGRLHRMKEYGILDAETTSQFMLDIAPARSIRKMEEAHDAEFGYAHPKARFRVSVFLQKGVVSVSLRRIPYELMSFEQIGLHLPVKKLLYAPRGLILVVGPTGCGKTTTLATMIDYINANRDVHIITIEDPIEYLHRSKKSIITQREVGEDVPSFTQGVIESLRQDPDVILVGEMRDTTTISAAVTAAETGHLVFATLHTTGAARTVDRIVDAFPCDQQEQVRTQLSGSLTAVISQLLLPRKDGQGRTAAFEVMIATPAVQHMIRDKKSYSINSVIQTGKAMGMYTLDDCLWERYQSGLLDRNEMLRVAEKPAEILEKIGEKIPKPLAR